MEKNIDITKLEHFFICNNNMKRMLYDLKMNSEDSFNIESKIKYGDKLYRGLKYMEIELLTIINDFSIDDKSKNIILNRFKSYYNDFLNCNYETNKFNNFYKSSLSNMDNKLVNRVKNECFGYNNNNLESLLNDCLTINEILHVFHSYIVNDKNIYKAMPVVAKKINDEGKAITLSGKANKIAADIYNYYPTSISSGDVDIISLDKTNNILVMIRDRGHALSIEIDAFNENDIKVNYLIPKLCNVEMINNLKGVNKVPVDAPINGYGTTGMFFTNKEDICVDLYNFINEVPMDSDMLILKNINR